MENIEPELGVHEHDSNNRTSIIQGYRETIMWLERSIIEINKPSPDYSFLQLCTEKSASYVTTLFYKDEESNRKEMLEGVFKSLSYVNKRLMDGLSNVRCSSESVLSAGSSHITESGCNSPTKSDGFIHEDKQLLLRQQSIQDTIVTENHVTFEDVIGLQEAKQSLSEAIVMPLLYPHLFTGNRKPWTRILLYGPPGTGKSRLAHAVSNRIDSLFYSVSSSDLLSSWFGESEKMIRDLFRHARNSHGRSVVFIDEVDSLCRRRKEAEEEGVRRIKTELLRELDGIPCNDDVFILCATNCPWEIDPAFLRRFQKRVYIPLPDVQSRISIMKLHSGEDSNLSESDWTELGKLTSEYSGSDLATLVNTALFEPLRELQNTTRWMETDNGRYKPCRKDSENVLMKKFKDIPPSCILARSLDVGDFKNCLETSKPTVTSSDLKLFESFTDKFGQTGN